MLLSFFSATETGVFLVQKYCFKSFIVCFENGKSATKKLLPQDEIAWNSLLYNISYFLRKIVVHYGYLLLDYEPNII